MTMRHHYKAFGLHIHSEWKLPELMPALHEAEAQLVIETGRVEAFSPPEAPRPDRAPEESAYYQATPSRVILHWPEVGSFAVEEGEQITIDVNPGVDKDLARLPLLGPVFAALLLQRKRLVLHASAVRVDDEAVGIIGAKGAGKSTTSAALHHYGCPVITDDLLALRSGGDDLIADPSFPRFKLWPDAAKAALNDDPTTLSPLHVRVQKRARLARQGFSTDPLPLKVLYVLSGGQSLRLDALRGAQALTHLLPHAYNNPLVSAIGSPAIRQWHFEACASLTQRVPVHLLQRPADLDRLAEIAEAIIQDARQLP